MLKPEELRVEGQTAGTFVTVRNQNGHEHKVTPIVVSPDWGCTKCSFYGVDDCPSVHCWDVIWISPDSFTEYLEYKLLK